MYVLISHLFKGKDIKIVSVHDSYMSAYERWQQEDNPNVTPRRWHAIREPGDLDGLVEKALDTLRLTDRQKSMLVATLNARRDPKGRRGSPSQFIYEAKGSGAGFDVPVTFKQLEKKGLMNADGMKYGAKLYYLPERGKAVAKILQETGRLGSIEAFQARLNRTYGKDKAPRVTEVKGDSYKIAGSDIWRTFPTPGNPMRESA